MKTEKEKLEARKSLHLRKVMLINPDGSLVELEGLHKLKKGDVYQLHPAGDDDEHLTSVETCTAASQGWLNDDGSAGVRADDV